MRNVYFFAIYLCTFAFVIACAATHPDDVDRIPPDRPNLISHLGFVGDRGFEDGEENKFILGTDDKPLRDNNNGIGPVSDGSEIRLQWDRVHDNPGGSGVQWIYIYRHEGIPDLPEDYTDIDLLSTFEELDRVHGNETEYFDIFSYAHTAEHINWHYFIRAIDHAGNESELSDIVNFELINKARLESPVRGTLLNNSTIKSTKFTWWFDGYAENIRLLIFSYNENDEIEYFWSKDLEHISMIVQPFFLLYDGPDLPIGSYFWRVDVKGWTHGTLIPAIGSQSHMWEFRITH